MEVTVYNQTGKETGTVALPEGVFDVAWNADLVHQVAISMQANARTPVAHTKNRGEVRGGGKKPWRQKGTGRARHGSIRSPLWRGGGVTFGPRNDKDYSKKINKKMSAGALAALLSQKVRDNEVLFVDRFTFSEPKTKEAKRVIMSLSGINGFTHLATKRKNAALIAMGERNHSAEKSFHNFGNIETKSARVINALDLLRYKYLILAEPDTTLRVLKNRVKRGVST